MKYELKSIVMKKRLHITLKFFLFQLLSIYKEHSVEFTIFSAQPEQLYLH